MQQLLGDGATLLQQLLGFSVQAVLVTPQQSQGPVTSFKAAFVWLEK
jgi:hypothetical protein